MAQVDPVTSHNTDNPEDWEDDGIYEGASAETIAAREAEIADETDDEPVQVAPIRYEPVYTWPSHGILVGELSYADFGDLGKSQGGGVGLGHVMMTAENAKMIPLRECIVLYKEASGVRWLNQGSGTDSSTARTMLSPSSRRWKATRALPTCKRSSRRNRREKSCSIRHGHRIALCPNGTGRSFHNLIP